MKPRLHRPTSTTGLLLLASALSCQLAPSQGPRTTLDSIDDPERYEALVDPPCSYCSSQDKKGLLDPGDRVLAWLRGEHNGGAIPLRPLLCASRVLQSSYGLFVFDPDGCYAAAYEPGQGYRFHGWRNGIMVVESEDGTLWQALSGRAFFGPRAGERWKRVPSLTTEWGQWLMLHPESATYDLFDGKRYRQGKLPTQPSRESRDTMGLVDWRLAPLCPVLGVEGPHSTLAVPLVDLPERTCLPVGVDGLQAVVFWYGPTRTAVAYRPEVDGRALRFHADAMAPETAPFFDEETGSRWTIAGRAVDGPLRGKTLDWMPSIQCSWFAWVSVYPTTNVHELTP